MAKSIKEAQDWAFSLLTKNNIQQAKLESELLIRSLFGWDRSKLFLNWDEKLPEDKFIILNQLLQRRIKNEPLQYILGEQEFYGRKFIVNPDVLIPRPETEILVEAVMSEADKIWGNNRVTVVDIGTGSGAIAITIALERNYWSVHSVDISAKALNTATVNANNHKANVIFHHGSILEPLVTKGIKTNIIVSNPPYIPSQQISGLMNEVKNFEPLLALDGGKDGLNFYRQIIAQSKQILLSPSLIAFEVGIDQAEKVKELLNLSGAAENKIISDLQGISRIVIARFT